MARKFMGTVGANAGSQDTWQNGASLVVARRSVLIGLATLPIFGFMPMQALRSPGRTVSLRVLTADSSMRIAQIEE